MNTVCLHDESSVECIVIYAADIKKQTFDRIMAYPFLNICEIVAYSEDQGEWPQNELYHHGLHCLLVSLKWFKSFNQPPIQHDTSFNDGRFYFP